MIEPSEWEYARFGMYDALGEEVPVEMIQYALTSIENGKDFDDHIRFIVDFRKTFVLTKSSS